MDIVELIGQDYTVVGTGRWLRTTEHDSLVIDAERNLFFWNSRGLAGDAISWLTDVKGMKYGEAKKLSGDSTRELTFNPDRYMVRDISSNSKSVYINSGLVDVFHSFGREHRDYWREYRGYTDETIDRFRLGYTGEWYTIPIYVDGVFVNFQCRKQSPKIVRPWYHGLGALPFNFSILAVTDWVVITEGPPDAIMCRQNNIPAVSQTAGAGYFKPAWLKAFNTIKDIFIVYNDDVAGNQGAIQTAEYFGYKAKIYNFWNSGKQGFDITDYFKQGGTKKEFMELLDKDSKYYFEVTT